VKTLTDIQKDFANWYQDVIFEAELVDSSPTKGSMVIRPYGYAIWENIQKVIDKKIKDLGANNAYFPLLIPESFLKKEAKHVEGFAPEVAVVTHAGGKKLEEPLIIRPTSETIIYYMFARWIHSWRDLPLKINQWANVVRWEMRPRAFLRTTEFLWQEGHTAHASQNEADQMAIHALEMYTEFAQEYLAIPVFKGEKTVNERFAGADKTYCIEAIMPDGRGLQMATSHLLAKSFPASFEIAFQDETGAMQVPYCTSWGLSTRVIGGLIMSHGDQNGLILPPKIAPTQIVIVPIYKDDAEKATVLPIAQKICHELSSKDFRVVLDDDATKTPGAKFFHWELRGVPLRLEIGPKDIEKNSAVLVNRAEPNKQNKKHFVPQSSIVQEVESLLNAIQKQLFNQALAKRKVVDGDYLEKFSKALEEGDSAFISGFCGNSACEAKLKEFKGTIRCCLSQKNHKECFSCKKPSVTDVLIAKSY
jgi:prolyl-tRNA synthetase